MKKSVVLSEAIFIISILMMCVTLISSQETKSTAVEVNIFGTENPDEIIGIEVPDYIFLGNITDNDMLSDEVKIYVNNTGNVNITVIPQLKDANEPIFSYLRFRTRQQSSNEALNKFYTIGDYGLNIPKPAIGKKSKSEYCYIQLNLTGADIEINQNLIGYKKEIIFYAEAS